MNHLPLPPIFKSFIYKWMKAGAIFNQEFEISLSGTPQGGIISPVIANFVLDGLEETVRNATEIYTRSANEEKTVRYKDSHGKIVRRLISLKLKTVRFADDFVVFGRSRRMLLIIKKAITEFLKVRGVELSEEKTKILSMERDSLDFLGYTFKYRRYWKPQYGFVKRHIGGEGIAMYPEKKKVRAIIHKLRETFRENTNLDSYNLIAKLNPIIRG